MAGNRVALTGFDVADGNDQAADAPDLGQLRASLETISRKLGIAAAIQNAPNMAEPAIILSL